jgi:hypothetical protein
LQIEHKKSTSRKENEMSYNENDYITFPKVGRAIGAGEIEKLMSDQGIARLNKSISQAKGQIALMEITGRGSRLPPLPPISTSSDSDITTLYEAKQEFKKCKDSEKDVAFRRWLELCKTPGDAKSAFKFTSYDHRMDWAFKRWLELCKSISDVKSALKYTGRDHRKDWAFKHWLELCKTPGDAKSAFKFTSYDHRMDWAFKRWLELCRTPNEARSALRYTNRSHRKEWAQSRIDALS